MNAKKVLFPTDFSMLSDAALDYAATLAKDGELLIVHVEEPPIAYGAGEMYYGVSEPDTQTLTKMLHELAPADSTVRCRHRLVIGNPADEIVQIAAEENVDLIVMGTHGRTGLKRFLMGSVAEAVVRKAKCPVLTVKPHHNATVKSA